MHNILYALGTNIINLSVDLTYEFSMFNYTDRFNKTQTFFIENELGEFIKGNEKPRTFKSFESATNNRSFFDTVIKVLVNFDGTIHHVIGEAKQ